MNSTLSSISTIPFHISRAVSYVLCSRDTMSEIESDSRAIVASQDSKDSTESFSLSQNSSFQFETSNGGKQKRRRTRSVNLNSRSIVKY